MKLRSLLILLLISLAAILSAQATNLIISEYVEGSSYQKAIEIFNGTGSPVDLSTVSLKKQTNGAGAFGSELVLSGTLANNDVFVIVNASTGGTNLVGQPYVDLATTSQAVNFNGNDAVALFRNGVMIDVVGIVDQVENWGIDVTWVRNSNIASPTTVFNMAEWTEYPINTFTYLGSHTFTGGTTDPIIIVSVPNTATTWYLEQTYTIGWSSANITGDVKIELSDNSVLSTLAASTPNDGSWDWTIPGNQALGNQFKVKISTLDDSVSDISDEFFTIAVLPVTDVTSISQLRTQTADGTTIYRLTSEAVMTYKQTYRNKKYFQDATGAIEIDDFFGVIASPYEIGDGATNLIGYLSVYHNLLQFTPYADPGAATSTGNDITPAIVTISDLNANFDNYESQLVMIENTHFLDTSAPFATGTDYMIADATGQIDFRTNFFEADYIGQPIPTGSMNMRVICTQYDATNQVTARFLADFTPVANEDFINEISPISLINNYPNPFSQSTRIDFNLKTPQPVMIEIFNTKGQLVRTLKSDVNYSGKNSLEWDAKDESGNAVSAGVYLFNVKSGRYTSSKKMILLK